MRIGFGYDAHRLDKGHRLMLGGVHLKHENGLVSHSDGDVVLHAICDALLGAAGIGDIGCHFPDTDPQYQGISSLKLLSSCREKIKQTGYRIVNLDTLILAEEPKISPHTNQMKQRIAETLEIDPTQINIKATTMEKMGPFGRGEGIGAYCTALLTLATPIDSVDEKMS